MRVNFQELKLQAEKTVKCPVCGKRVVRRKTFFQTINPFNKNKQGFPKSREEIYQELKERRNEWKDKAEICGKCEVEEV